jgi:hypothetical protein
MTLVATIKYIILLHILTEVGLKHISLEDLGHQEASALLTLIPGQK